MEIHHPEKGTMQTTAGAYERVWAQRGWSATAVPGRTPASVARPVPEIPQRRVRLAWLEHAVLAALVVAEALRILT